MCDLLVRGIHALWQIATIAQIVAGREVVRSETTYTLFLLYWPP